MLMKTKETNFENSHFREYLLSGLAYLEVNQRQLALDSI